MRSSSSGFLTGAGFVSHRRNLRSHCWIGVRLEDVAGSIPAGGQKRIGCDSLGSSACRMSGVAPVSEGFCQFNELFNSILNHEPTDQATELENATRGNPDLRQKLHSMFNELDADRDAISSATKLPSCVAAYSPE